MAKTSKAVSPSIIRATSDALCATLYVLSHAAAGFKADKQDASAVMLAALVGLRAELSGAAYLGAVVAICGTSGVHHSKPEYVAGTLRADFENEIAIDKEMSDFERECAVGVLKTQLSYIRKVANWIADPLRFKDATDGAELRTLYDAAVKAGKPVTPTSTKADDKSAPGAATVTTLAQLIATFGIGAVLRGCSAILASDKGTKTQAASIAAIAVQVAA